MKSRLRQGPGGFETFVSVATWPDGWEMIRYAERPSVQRSDFYLSLMRPSSSLHSWLTISPGTEPKFMVGGDHRPRGEREWAEWGRWRWFIEATGLGGHRIGPGSEIALNTLKEESIPGAVSDDLEAYLLLGEPHPFFLEWQAFLEWVDALRMNQGT